MCRAHTVLAYSIAVSTPSLLYAADALPHLEPSFLFFDLVTLRLREGRLEALVDERESAAQRMPIEVFEMIRKEVVALELADARTAIVEQVLCAECFGRWGDDAGWDDPRLVQCDLCCNYASDFLGLQDEHRLKRVRHLLKRYHLALPISIPIRASKDVRSCTFYTIEADPSTAAFISIPPSPSSGHQSFVSLQADCGGDAEPDQQAVVDVFFHEPANALQRFKALVREFPLELLDAADRPEATDGTGSSGKKETQTRFKHVNLADVQPRWKLFTTCETIW